MLSSDQYSHLMTRVIPCLDVRDGRVVKGERFQNLRDSGDPVELAARYAAEGADEIVLLDVSATIEARRTQLDTVRRVRAVLPIPLTVGGDKGFKNRSGLTCGLYTAIELRARKIKAPHHGNYFICLLV